MLLKFQFVTDVEGDLRFFKKQIHESHLVRFSDPEETTLEFINNNPHEIFVFGGDVCDRGDDISVAMMLINFKQSYPDRVILIVGNRDANKTRFSNELPLNPSAVLLDDIDAVIKPEGASKTFAQFLEETQKSTAKVHNTPLNRLKWILSCTMGSPLAFDCRRNELARLRHGPISEEDVYRSFRESIEPEGFMRRYLSLAQIGAIIGDTLIVHGGVSQHNLGKVPNGFVAFEIDQSNASAFFKSDKKDFLLYDNAHEWITQLNRWYAMAIDRWFSSSSEMKFYGHSNSAPASPLQHIAIGPGSYFHGQLPVVGNFLKDRVTPWPIADEVSSYLKKSGINRIVAGHQPNSGTPLVLFGTATAALSRHAFQVVTCDTLYGNAKAYDAQCGAQIRAQDPRGTSFATVYVTYDTANHSSSVLIKGVDGYNIPYERTLGYPRGPHEDRFVGRVLQQEQHYYLVRVNWSGNPAMPYVLTHTAQDYTVTQREASEAELIACEKDGQFLTQYISTKKDLATLLRGIELIIFDVDGTILKDTHIQYWKHLNKASSHHANKQWSDAQFRQYLSRPEGYTTRQHIVASMLEQDPSQDSDLVRKTMDFFYQSFCEDQEKSELFPHVVMAVTELTRCGIPSIAFSDTEEVLVRKMLSDYNLHSHFESVVGQAKKPDTTVLHHALKNRSSHPQITGKNILVIGDNLKTDGALAERAGCAFLYFSGGAPQKADEFFRAREAGTIPKDSLMINSHGEVLDAMDDLLESKCGVKNW